MSQNQIDNSDPPSNEDITVTSPLQQNTRGDAQQKKEEASASPEKNGKLEVSQQKVDSSQNVSLPQEQEMKSVKKQKGKSEEVLTITVKQLKKMNKKIMQLDTVKEEYEKMRKNYEILRGDRDQYKITSEDISSKNQELTKKLQEKEQELQLRGKEVEGLRRDKQILLLRVEEVKKIQQNKQVLEEKVKQLEMIVDMTATNAEAMKKSEEKWRGESQKFKQLLRIQKQASNNMKSQIQKLRNIVSQTFVLKQELNRLNGEYEILKVQKEQMPIMIDKFQHQELLISQLKQTITQIEKKHQDVRSLNDKFQKKINLLMEEKKEGEKKFNKIRLELEQVKSEAEVLKMELEEDKNSWEVQRKRYATDIKTLKTELHHEHEKLKITEWELNQSKKKEKKPVQIERVNIHQLSKDDLLNYLEEMQMKTQSLKLTINTVADQIHKKDKKIKEQEESIMALARQITKDYPNYAESQGMDYVEKEIIEIGRNKKEDYGEIVEKVMIENLRLKYSVTALGEEYNQKLRKQFQK